MAERVRARVRMEVRRFMATVRVWDWVFGMELRIDVDVFQVQSWIWLWTEQMQVQSLRRWIHLLYGTCYQTIIRMDRSCFLYVCPDKMPSVTMRLVTYDASLPGPVP